MVDAASGVGYKLPTMVRASLKLASAIKAASVPSAAKASGLPTRSIQSYLEGTVPSLDRAQALAEAIGLEFYIGPRRQPDPENPPGKTQVAGFDAPSLAQADDRLRRLQESLFMMTVVLDELMPAETWGTADSDGLHTIGDGWFRIWMARHGAIPDQCGMTDVESDEMEPTLPPGSAVVVDRSRRKPSEAGVFMLRDGERRLFRRLRRGESGGWVAYGDHPLCEDSRPVRRPKVVGKVLWSAHDLRDDIGPFARSPRAVYMLFARQVERPALVQAAREVPLEALDAFAREAAQTAEERYEKLLSAAGFVGA